MAAKLPAVLFSLAVACLPLLANDGLARPLVCTEAGLRTNRQTGYDANCFADNNRLQSTQMSLGALWTLQNEYTRPTIANNGNLWKQRLTIPGKPTIVTAYGYDGVNRLAVAEERPGDENAPVCDTANTATLSTDGRWCQKFGYDRWANRLLSAKAGVGQGTSESSGKSSKWARDRRAAIANSVRRWTRAGGPARRPVHSGTSMPG